MTAFSYQHERYCAESVPLSEIAVEAGTPVHVYSSNRIRRNFTRLNDALSVCGKVQLCYAVKANPNLAVLRILAALGAGADIVSGGELARALAAGIAPSRIVYSGVGKTEAELQMALQAGIHQINVESIAEIDQVAAVAAQLGVVANIAFRLNPDVAADTHNKIATGRKGDKFGIDYEQMLEAAARAGGHPSLNLCGLAVHIGSQLFDIEIYRAAFTVVAGYVAELREAGFAISRLDLGGGMGVPYHDEAPFDCEAFARMVNETVGSLGCTLSFEPGRYIVADAGVLLTKVLLVKEGVADRFVVVDAAMTDLIRPALYEAYHGIVPVKEPVGNRERLTVDVVGPVCESGDCFAQDRSLPPVREGDLLAFQTTGAYGAAMASTYNSRPLVPEVLVDGVRWAIIRPRIDAEAQMEWERMPEWLLSCDYGTLSRL